MAEPRKLFVNLAVRDLRRSVDFFTKLGFAFDPRFADEKATCMIVGDDAFVMLLEEDRFREFTHRPLCDTSTHTEGLFALSCRSRAAVDALVETALAGGGRPAMEPQDHGFMVQRSFYDLDGHHWEVLWMDPEAAGERGMEKVYELYIATTPERLWQAITDPALRARYNFGASIRSDWKPGARYEMSARGGSVPLGEGEILEIVPPRRLVQTMVALWSDEVKSEGPSRITWEIERIADDSCRLVVTHDRLREGAHGELYGGWPMILSGLKTLLETGRSLTTPGSLRYAEAGPEEGGA